MQNLTNFYCAFCGEINTTFVDISGGIYQKYTEDCQVCCRPNTLYITVDLDTLDIEINTDFEE